MKDDTAQRLFMEQSMSSGGVGTGHGVGANNDNFLSAAIKGPLEASIGTWHNLQQKVQVAMGLVFAKLCAGMQGAIGALTPTGIAGLGKLKPTPNLPQGSGLTKPSQGRG